MQNNFQQSAQNVIQQEVKGFHYANSAWSASSDLHLPIHTEKNSSLYSLHTCLDIYLRTFKRCMLQRKVSHFSIIYNFSKQP